jgi:hypothetical protein
MSALAPRIAQEVELLHRKIRHRYSTAHTQFIAAQVHFTTVFQRPDVRPKAALYTVLLLVTLFWLATTLTCYFRARRLTPPNTPNLEKRSPFKAPERPFGGI